MFAESHTSEGISNSAQRELPETPLPTLTDSKSFDSVGRFASESSHFAQDDTAEENMNI